MIAGRYSLDREIGRGGSGVVWLGRDEVLGRQVALKRIGLLPGADRTDLARAEREARLSAQLNHRHVVAVFDVVTEAESDARWLVMEYVDGVNLGQLVKSEGKLSPDAAAPLLLQAADALVAAHAAGIVHRDVKPSNILLDRARQVKLTDFGIARVATDATLTQTGMVTGSPAYLAPEIALGQRGDEAADVWSLGVTAYHVLAGRPPYEVGEHVLGALYRIVNEEPPRLPDASWMAPLLEGTMVRDPSQRWSMAQVREFLDDPGHRVPVLSASARKPSSGGTRPIATLPPTPAPDSSLAPRRRKRPLLLVLLGLLVAAVVAGGIYAASLSGGDSDDQASGNRSTPSAEPTPTAKPAQPTAAGMEAFIRSYVAAVAADPAKSWQMLTPKFQVESGGFDTYDAYWRKVTDGRVLSISANPDNLSVSYQVRFENFDNGPGPTVLDLSFTDGRYLIDGERTQGFTPAG